ncbi:MAG: hypothetical protein JOY77_05880 [Alphaproteobacteria bacterium]|nr:hypothetical protein [Alphaproteobacteria bacterium]MBV9062441.1 hypothetical protein [Alphaproteobacteria bacterium]
MRLWWAPALLWAIAVAIPLSGLRYVENRIDTYPHGLQKRDVYGDPLVNFGSKIVDYACGPRGCPTHGRDPRFGFASVTLFVLLILVPMVLLVIGSFLAGRASNAHR